MEIKHIRTFIRAAELENITAAARELGYAQSTVTQQIRQLEHDLNTSLFCRNGKTVTLSAAGREFLQYAYQIIQYETLAIEHFSPSGEPAGELNIGTMETICASGYSSLFREFQDAFPKIDLKLQIVTTHQALEYLQKGNFDLIFLLDNKISDPDLITAREYPVDIHFFCSSHHPLADKKDVPLERLLQERFILTEKGCNYRQVFESELAARGKSLHCTTEIGYSPYILRAVSDGQGIGLLPSITLTPALEDAGLSVIYARNYRLRMSIQVIYSNKRPVSTALRAFLDMLQRLPANLSV